MNYLKDKREVERQDEVSRRMDQKFKGTTDELRQEDQKFNTAGTQIEREKQLMDKRKKMQQNLLEEQVFAKLWQLEEQKKVEREIIEAAEKQKAI